MIFRYIFITLILFTLSACKNKTSKTTETNTLTSHLYFVRHAEKDRSNPDNDNPNLTKEGLLRAENLSTKLNDFHIDTVYSTNYNRTLQTAKPTANKNNIDITIYKPSEFDITKILNAHKNILVVGHSNTVPQLVNSIIKSDVYKDIEDSDFGNLYHVTVTDSQVSDYELTRY